MKKIILLCACALTPAFGFCQTAVQAAVPKQMRAQMTLDRMSDTGGIARTDLLYGIPSAPGTLVGDFYLDNKWNKGTIMLNETETLIEGYPLKYDLKAQTVEILAKGGIKLLDTKKVKSIVWLDSLTQRPTFFVNAANYKEDGTPLAGLLEVVADGAMPLFCRSTLWIKKSTYVPAFDVGNKDEIINKKKTFYYRGENNELKKITGKKKLLPAFGTYAADVDAFIRKNDLGTNDRADLQRIFEYYNAKVTTTQP